MHSFRHSRSRILFEVFCALAISASCLGAWMQTDAWALLAAAAVAALYGFVHVFDLGGRNPQAVVDRPEGEGATDFQSDLAAAQPAAPTEQLEAAIATEEEAERVEPTAPRKRQTSRAKARRKGGDRQAGAADDAKIAEPAPPAEAEAALLMPPEEVAHLHIEPLFEAEPFVRMQRQAFGRKAG